MSHAPFPGNLQDINSWLGKKWLIDLENRVHDIEDVSAILSEWTAASASAAASLDFAEDTDNGTNVAKLIGPASIAGDITITLPSTTGTLYVSGGTDVAVGDGGTGASTAAGAATNLGLGTGNSPQFTAVNIGHASDTTVTRHAAGILAVEGIAMPRMDGSSVGTKDNAIVRVSGTGGGLIQGQTSDLGPIINDDGSVVNTVQPAFLAYNSASDNNQTGNGAVATVDFDTEVFDQGGDFASDTFTAPVTGRYLLSVHVFLTSITAATADLARALLVTSNRTILVDIWQETNGVPTSVYLCGSIVTDMDAADTARVDVDVTGMAGDTVQIYGEASPVTRFSGCLLA